MSERQQEQQSLMNVFYLLQVSRMLARSPLYVSDHM